MKTFTVSLSIIILCSIMFCANAMADAETMFDTFLRKSGCCSSHRGVSKQCTATGRVVCNDRSLSPTCRCQPPRPRPNPSVKPSKPPSGTPRNYSGTYSGTLQLINNTCKFDLKNSLSTTAVVTDSGQSIRVTLPGGKVFAAQPSSPQGFEFYIDENLGTFDGVSCTQNDHFWWYNVSTAGSLFRDDVTIRCSNKSSCGFTYFGNVTRR